jgi:hypothetical protein
MNVVSKPSPTQPEVAHHRRLPAPTGLKECFREAHPVSCTHSESVVLIRRSKSDWLNAGNLYRTSPENNRRSVDSKPESNGITGCVCCRISREDDAEDRCAVLNYRNLVLTHPNSYEQSQIR